MKLRGTNVWDPIWINRARVGRKRTKISVGWEGNVGLCTILHIFAHTKYKLFKRRRFWMSLYFICNKIKANPYTVWVYTIITHCLLLWWLMQVSETMIVSNLRFSFGPESLKLVKKGVLLIRIDIIFEVKINKIQIK